MTSSVATAAAFAPLLPDGAAVATAASFLPLLQDTGLAVATAALFVPLIIPEPPPRRRPLTQIP